MKHTFFPQGVCSTRIDLETDGETIRRIEIEDGCDGNLKGLVRLAEGREISEVARILAGIKCGDKDTSCPDQLARALKNIAAGTAKRGAPK